MTLAKAKLIRDKVWILLYDPHQIDIDHMFKTVADETRYDNRVEVLGGCP